MANIPPNIERFNLTVIHLFNDLYDSFPTAIDVDTSMLGIKAAPEGLSGAEILTYAMCAGDVVRYDNRVRSSNVANTLNSIPMTLVIYR